jgi:hypothetical protein
MVASSTKTPATGRWSMQAHGTDQAERLHGFRTPSGDKCPFFRAGPPGCWTHRTIVLNTRTPITEWWSVQDFGYGTRLTGHTGSGPPYGTGIRSLEPAPRPPLFL